MQKKNGPSKTERVVDYVYHDGKVEIVRMNAATVSVGDELVLLRGKRSAFAKIQAIQNDDVAVDSFVATGGEKLGIELSHKCTAGEVLCRIKVDEPRLARHENLFVIVELAGQ
jgi:hypothetical protein